MWLLVTNKAKEVFTSGLFEVYALHIDGSESLCESIDDVNRALEWGEDLGIEVGTLDTTQELVKSGEFWYVGKAQFRNYDEALNYKYEKQFRE